MQTTFATPQFTDSKPEHFSLAFDISCISNPTLARLLDEVKNDEECSMGGYDRTHNRHNR